MGDSGGSVVSVDVERISFGGKEHHIQTNHGSVSVAIYGDHDKPALITYPDIALNHMSCFQGLLFCPEAASLLLHNFCIYHISPPGHELGAAPILPSTPVASVDDLADQVADVLDFFGLDSVMCLGVTAGAYILTLFATKYRERVLGLILVSPLCKAPSWSEWFYNKVMSNLLYYYGMCNVVKDILLQRYFGKGVRGCSTEPESDIVQACRSFLDQRQGMNVWRFIQTINERKDLTENLKQLQCRTLIFVGENSQFHAEAVHMTAKLDSRYSALVEVSICMHINFSELLGLYTKFVICTGTSLRVSCDRGAATCNAYTNGILPYGIRLVQAKPDKLQPSQSSEPVLHISGAPLAREHGGEVKANQDASQVKLMPMKTLANLEA
ncbi:unnamed protein product [Urochloa decumbens]|uniref:Pollen-specific protein SF21 n=1 Tax=Urochloa decumbens TaxID=240449 RepID=A0ABC9EBB6_9POAL